MTTTVLTTTCILIALGVLMKRFPKLIAGYGTLSVEERKFIDIKGLSSFMCFSFVGMGIVSLLAFYICLGLGHADWAGLSLLLPLAYIPFLIVKANKFDHNPSKRSRKYVVSISIFAIILVGFFMLYAILPAQVRVKQGEIVFTGMFGTSKPVESFSNIRISYTLPEISRRLNGLSVGGINKGRFSLANGSSCIMYLASNESPYIVLTEQNGKEIFFNTKRPVATFALVNGLATIIPATE